MITVGSFIRLWNWTQCVRDFLKKKKKVAEVYLLLMSIFVCCSDWLFGHKIQNWSGITFKENNSNFKCLKYIIFHFVQFKSPLGAKYKKTNKYWLFWSVCKGKVLFYRVSLTAHNQLHNRGGIPGSKQTPLQEAKDHLLTCKPGKFWCAVLFTHHFLHTGLPRTANPPMQTLSDFFQRCFSLEFLPQQLILTMNTWNINVLNIWEQVGLKHCSSE